MPATQGMVSHADMLRGYKRLRDAQFQLNNRLVGTIPSETLQECGRKLGLFREGRLVLGSPEELPILMDYCFYSPGPDGQNLVAKYLDKSPPPAEMVALRRMISAYYSLFQITEVERGVGVAVNDLLRRETGFIVDIGLGNSAVRHLMLATRMIPTDGFLMSGGAPMPVGARAATRILADLPKLGLHPTKFDFKHISPSQEAELAASMIRTCLSSGMTSAVSYEEPGRRSQYVEAPARAARVGRNEPCPCGSGAKFKKCCGRNQ